MYFMPLNCTLKMVVYGVYASPLEKERKGEKEKGKGKDVLVKDPLTIERASGAGPSAFIVRSRRNSWVQFHADSTDRLL